jgi:4-amino-4-deoxy-L-arabinose transferase-like glycosyltransferase
VIGLAAANFLWQLGASSYFVDEVESVTVAVHPFSGLLHAIATSEISPPAYFVFLHEWLGHVGSSVEWVARLPSALCGAALVGGVYWLASVLCGRRAIALGAATLTALSPFVLEYAQLAQEYVFVMLAVTVAVAATLHAQRAESRRGLWLAGGAAAAILAMWLHYTAGLVVLALCVWVATRDAFPGRWRGAFVGACVAAGAILIPLFAKQYHVSHGRPNVAASADVTTTTVERIFATPLDGRVDALRVLGVVLTVGALVILLASRRGIVRERLLIAALAAGTPLALLVLSAFGAHLMLTRYAAVAAPFMIVAIAAAVAAARPRALGVVIAAGALLVCGAGLLASHRTQGFNLDARAVARYIRARERPGDVVVASNEPGSALPLLFYGLRPDWIGTATTTALVSEHKHRLWVIELGWDGSPSAAAVLKYAQSAARSLGYRVTRVRVFPAIASLTVVLAVPLASHTRPTRAASIKRS